MDIYHYHPLTKEFVAKGEGDISPLEPNVCLVPAHATQKAPPVTGPNKIAVYDKSSDRWSVKPDWRGKTYWLNDGSKHTINEIGVEPPADSFDDLPPPSSRDIAEQKITQLKEYCERAIVLGFESSALGEPHTYKSGRDDQTNLLGAVSTDSDMPLKCADSSGIWVHRQHTSVQLKQVLADEVSQKTRHLQALAKYRSEVERIVADSNMSDDQKRDAIGGISW